MPFIPKQSKSRSPYGLALDELRAFGFDQPPRPDGTPPIVPSDLNDLTDAVLMELHTTLTAWANYAAFLVTRADVKEEEAETALAYAEAKYVVTTVPRGERGIQRANKERFLDDEIIDLQAKLTQAKALRKMMTTMFESIERSIATTSRDLSRRIGLARPQGRQQWSAP